jgi:hypothetical protein
MPKVFLTPFLIVGALITSALLSGCAAKSNDNSLPAEKSPELITAIKDACDSLQGTTISGLTLMNERVALKFNEMAKLNDDYTEIAVDAFTILTIQSGWKLNIDNKELQAEQLKATARLVQFCAANGGA